MATFVTSQFTYCCLVYKSHSKTMMNKRIDKIHEKVLKLVHKKMNQNFFFDSLLKKKDNSVEYTSKKTTNSSDRNL